MVNETEMNSGVVSKAIEDLQKDSGVPQDKKEVVKEYFVLSTDNWHFVIREAVWMNDKGVKSNPRMEIQVGNGRSKKTGKRQYMSFPLSRDAFDEFKEFIPQWEKVLRDVKKGYYVDNMGDLK